MSQVFIHYFSGTGNTKRAVDLITAELTKNGYEVRQFLIGKDKPQISENAGNNLIAFPVLAWAAPGFVTRYVRHLPEGRGVKATVLAVCAGGPVQALQNMEGLLKRKHFDVSLTGTVLYPDNWTQMMNPPAETEQQEMIQQGDQMVLQFAASFLKDERKLFRSGWFGYLLTAFVSIIFKLMGSRYLGKAYIADSKCNQCGICIKTCPVKTIRMKGFSTRKPYWSSSCQDCGRCINICPQKAIQMSVVKLLLHMMINIGLICAVIPLTGWAAKFLPPVFQTSGWVVALILAISIVLWFQLTIIDYLFFLLEQIPWIHHLFEWSFTRKFRRYIAPGFKPQV
jgi:Pyruvate/2-oxoacid:ferredoxin oxidoreductase delta subunit